MVPANCVKVKRDGPRGWHWIAASNYDPKVHVLIEGDPSLLTDREINADLEGVGVEFDSRDPKPVRLEQRRAGRAAKGR